MRYSAKVTSKGQLTVPAGLRRSLNLKPGDRVVFVEGSDGRVAVEARTGTFADLRGIVRVTGPADIDKWIEEARAARGQRALKGSRARRGE